MPLCNVHTRATPAFKRADATRQAAMWPRPPLITKTIFLVALTSVGILVISSVDLSKQFENGKLILSDKEPRL